MRRRRRRSERDAGNAMFGTIGWLFADLMLALALAFIVATTVLQPGAVATPPPTPPPTTTTTPIPPPPPPPVAEPALELVPVSIELPINSRLVLGNDAGATETLRQQVRADPRIGNRHAGLVLVFGGTNDYRNRGLGLSIANQVSTVLTGLGNEGFVFRGTVYRSFISPKSTEVLTIDVYLFKV